MRYRSSIGALTLAVAALMAAHSAARAFDESKYPDLKGQWVRNGNPNWVPVAGPAPLTTARRCGPRSKSASLLELL